VSYNNVKVLLVINPLTPTVGVLIQL